MAFPIMTLAFSITPVVARDFSLGIQACGMTAAAFTILWMRIQLEWNSILFCSFGGMFGVVVGLQWIDPSLTPAQKKMGFCFRVVLVRVRAVPVETGITRGGRSELYPSSRRGKL